jgi:hypothetical protein
MEIAPAFWITGQNFRDISRYFKIFIYSCMYLFIPRYLLETQTMLRGPLIRKHCFVALNIVLLNIVWRLLEWTEQNYASSQYGELYIIQPIYKQSVRCDTSCLQSGKTRFDCLHDGRTLWGTCVPVDLWDKIATCYWFEYFPAAVLTRQLSAVLSLGSCVYRSRLLLHSAAEWYMCALQRHAFRLGIIKYPQLATRQHLKEHATHTKKTASVVPPEDGRLMPETCRGLRHNKVFVKVKVY